MRARIFAGCGQQKQRACRTRTGFYWKEMQSFCESDLQATFATKSLNRFCTFRSLDDYDYNGTCEAMVVTQQPDGIHVHVWFVDSNGSIADLTGGHELCMDMSFRTVPMSGSGIS